MNSKTSSKKTQKPTLLIVDDSTTILSAWKRALSNNFIVWTATNYGQAEKLFNSKPDIVLLDIRLNDLDDNNEEGIELLKKFNKVQPNLPIVMTSAYGDVTKAVECMRYGAVDFVEKPCELGEIQQRLLNALKPIKSPKNLIDVKTDIQREDSTAIIGESPQINEVKEMIRIVSNDPDVSVLIRGESGTGKELVAQSIHDLSPRSQKPFVTVNCAAIPDNLLESELFGHEKGAFTGADSTRRGKFEEASGGSVFLDEIGDMSLSTQAKLLRVLQNKEIYRLGSNDKITVDVRIIAATHQPLETMLEKREFREDLYYRLKGVQINLPSLRERRQDISLLTDHFLELFSRNKQNKIESISNDAMNTLIAYVWPGNVRELQRVLEAAMIFADSQDHEQIELEDLPTDILAPNILQKKKVPVSLPENFKLLEHLARIELSYVEEALRLSEGKKTEAWKLLGLNDRFSLTRRVKAIFKKYPGMEENFRLVKKLFGTK